MKNKQYLLAGHIEIMPVDMGFVTPIFSCDGRLFIQNIDQYNIIETFEEIPDNMEFQSVNSDRLIQVGDECLFAFKFSDIKFDTFDNLVPFFINNVLSKDIDSIVRNCILSFIKSGQKQDIISVAIVDDSELFRHGIISILDTLPNIRVVFETGNGQELLEQLQIVSPDIILMEINIPVINGIEATKKISEMFPKIRVIILTSYHEAYWRKYAAMAGARGYLLKNISKEELRQAIVMVKETGQYPIDNHSFNDNTRIPDFAKEYNLTRRELEVLQYISRGFTNIQIADELRISIYTVETTRKNIMQRLSVRSTNELYAKMYNKTDSDLYNP